MLLKALSSFVVASAFAASTFVADAASGDRAVDEFVGRINAAIGSLKPGDAVGARLACRKLVEQAFDIGALAPATSPEAWKRMNSAQRAAYRSGIARKAANDCIDRSREFAGQELVLVGTRRGEGGDRFVATRGRGRTLIWQVRGAGRLRAVDVSVNGRSLVVAARRDAKAILQSSGGDLQALIKSVGG